MLSFPLSLLSCFSMCHIKLVAGFAKPNMWLISLVSAFAVWRFYFSLKLWYLGTPHLYHWRELPQISFFVTTNMCLSFVVTKVCLS